MHQVQKVFETPLGWIGLVGSASGLRVLTFGHRQANLARAALAAAGAESKRGPIGNDEPAWLAIACERLQSYASGEPVDLSEIPLDLPPATVFQQRVREILRNLPYGETLSYQELAARAGRSGAARAVGNIMARNPVPLVIPCHRVLAAGGRLGGFSAPQGVSMKKRLLEMEQAALTACGWPR